MDTECNAIEDFFTAVIKDDLATVESLILHDDIDVNTINSTHKTALYLALQHENIPLVRMLIEHGADLNKRSFCNMYNTFEIPLVTAVRVHNWELVQIVIDAGCGCEVDHLIEGKSALQWAATYGDIDMANTILANGTDVNWIGPCLQTALHYAVISDCSTMVDWLLQHEAKISQNGDGRSPLHIAAVKGNLAIVRSLLQHGADVSWFDNFRYTPFTLACLRGHMPIVQYMIQNCHLSPLALDQGLVRAADCGHQEVVQLLLKLGANVDSTVEIGGDTALAAAAKAHFTVVQLLLENDARLETVDMRGLTPLTNALLREQNEIAVLLIKHGANLDSQELVTGKPTPDSPLRIAYTMSNPLLVKYLIQAGVHLCKERWLHPNAVKEKQLEAEFQTPRSNSVVDEKQTLWQWVHERLGKTRTLRELSRRRIRQHTVACSGGRSVIRRLEYLPLPNKLKRYLALDDVPLE